MPSEEVILRPRKDGNAWYIYAAKGHEIAGPFRGTPIAAMEWARRFCSSWYNMNIIQENEEVTHET